MRSAGKCRPSLSPSPLHFPFRHRAAANNADSISASRSAPRAGHECVDCGIDVDEEEAGQVDHKTGRMAGEDDEQEREEEDQVEHAGQTLERGGKEKGKGGGDELDEKGDGRGGGHIKMGMADRTKG